MKKRGSSRSRDDDKDKCEALPRDENHASQHLPSMIGEIKTITDKPSI